MQEPTKKIKDIEEKLYNKTTALEFHNQLLNTDSWKAKTLKQEISNLKQKLERLNYWEGEGISFESIGVPKERLRCPKGCWQTLSKYTYKGKDYLMNSNLVSDFHICPN